MHQIIVRQQKWPVHVQAIAEMAVAEEKWEEALDLIKQHADLVQTVALPWGKWLSFRGRLEEAYQAYRWALLF
jgi:Tfp pilus assembly protein PilF